MGGLKIEHGRKFNSFVGSLSRLRIALNAAVWTGYIKNYQARKIFFIEVLKVKIFMAREI